MIDYLQPKDFGLSRTIPRIRTYSLNILSASRPGRGFPSGPAFILDLHRLVDDAADGVCRLPAHPLSGVGVSVQGEPCGVMPQGVG